MSVENAQDLFVEELKDIYSAEKQAIRAYPRLTKVVQSEELKQAMEEHLEQTRQQLERLEKIFEILEEKAGGKTCHGMQGLLEEAVEHKDEIDPGPVLDAALIGALQRVEHYEIAAYGTVATLAEAMGETEIHELLAATLAEEKATDGKLTEVAKTVNTDALSELEEGEEDEEDEEDDEVEDEEEEEAPKQPAKRSKR